ncbi:MAG: MFS transporter [Marivibrio sp.]|uniref:MFS transporter n=1 Tax=Marivibrio sp. TaxID=2039719 RepID=UPI0032EEA2A5
MARSAALSPYLSLAAIIGSITLLQLGSGLLLALMPLKMEAAGLPARSVGFVSTGYAAGFMAGCLFATWFVRWIGHIRAFAALAAVLAATTLAFTVSGDPWLWTGLRAFMGLCMAGLMTISDSWVSAQTPPDQRGRVLSGYMILNKLALAGGPMMLTFGEIAGPGFFMLISALYSISMLPVAFTHAPLPTLPPAERLGLRAVYRNAPAALIGCVAIGLMNSAVLNLAPLYGAQVGLAPAAAGALLTVFQLGSLLLQWPIGWLSDRMDRRRVIVGGALAVAAVSLALGLLGGRIGDGWMLFALVGLWGGVGLSIYAVCIAHATDFAKPEQMVALCSSLILGWAIGSAIGPTAGSLAMERLGPGGVFLYAAAVALALAGFVAYRMTRRRAKAPAERDPFVNLPATSPAIPQLDPRAKRAMAESVDEALGLDETPDGDDPAEPPRYSPSAR